MFISGENDVEYAEFSMAQGVVRQQSPVATPTSPCDYEERMKLLFLFENTETPNDNARNTRSAGNTVDTGTY